MALNRYKMNRAKARLKHMLEEYGQRGKLQAELLRLKTILKGITADLKEANARRDRYAQSRKRLGDRRKTSVA